MAEHAQQQQLLPWGRFKLVSKDPVDESDHLYFYRKTHRIGRNARRSDIILDKLFISSTHCVITFEDTDEADGEPTVMLQDLSRNGVYLNEVLVGMSNSAVLENNITVHFTKPGLRTRSITPTVYKFELLQDGLTEENTRLRNARESATYTPAAAPVRSAAVDVAVTQPEPSATPAQTASSSTPSLAATTSMIRPTQELSGQKRSADETELEIEATHNLSVATGDDGSATRVPTASSSAASSGSGSSAKKKRRSGGTTDAGSGDDDLNTSARIQQSNQKLRQQLQESRSQEVQLSAQLSEAEVEILSLTDQHEKCQEHGKKLKEELQQKDEELKERDQLIAQLKQDKLALEGKLADSVQALKSANEKIELQASVVEDVEMDKMSLNTKLATVTEQLGSSLSNVESLEEKVKALEVEKRKLSVARQSVLIGRESVEQDIVNVEEQKCIMADTLAKALKIFEAIHVQVLDGRNLKDTPGIAYELEKRRRRASEDSIIAEELRNLTDHSSLSLEGSLPTPVHSSDVNTQDPDEAETMDQGAAAADAPLPTLDPFLGGARQALQQQQEISSQDADEGEMQQLPTTSEGEVQGGTLDQQRGDSEESGVSARSASKTPPPKPIQMQSTPKKQEEVAAVEEIVVDGVDDDDDADDTVQEQEGGEAADKEDNADDDDKTSAAETKDDDDDDDEDEPPVLSRSATDQQRWLSTISHDESQTNASGDAGTFDDETQLSQ